jgi:hypothetical protein
MTVSQNTPSAAGAHVLPQQNQFTADDSPAPDFRQEVWGYPRGQFITDDSSVVITLPITLKGGDATPEAETDAGPVPRDAFEDASDLALAAARRLEPEISHSELKARLRKDGLI